MNVNTLAKNCTVLDKHFSILDKNACAIYVWLQCPVRYIITCDQSHTLQDIAINRILYRTLQSITYYTGHCSQAHTVQDIAMSRTVYALLQCPKKVNKYLITMTSKSLIAMPCRGYTWLQCSVNVIALFCTVLFDYNILYSMCLITMSCTVCASDCNSTIVYWTEQTCTHLW